MEDGLVQMVLLITVQCLPRLNPCCSGRWPRTSARVGEKSPALVILILVVVEDGLVPIKK